MDRGAWWAAVHGVTVSQTCLSTHICTLNSSEKILRVCWNSVFFYQHTQKFGSWKVAPLSVRGRWRWTFLDDGERSVPPTGVWPMPMLSVVSSAVESPSPPPKDQALWKEVIRSQQPDFTAQGQSPSCGVALWLPWVALTVLMATRPLWSAQVRERDEGYWYSGCSWSEMSPRAESEGKLASEVRYFMVKWFFLLFIHFSGQGKKCEGK